MSKPIVVDLEEGEKYFWCTCGKSADVPFCDGSHKGSGLKSLMFVPKESGDVKICCCQKTKNPPFCDGSHNQD